jgi:hypothetical protein
MISQSRKLYLNKKKREYRARNKLKGLCPCGRKVIENGYVTCKRCREKSKGQYYKPGGKEYNRNWGRKHRLMSRNKDLWKNGRINNLNKRDFPTDRRCELCEKVIEKRLSYHHWNHNNPSLGMWICGSCHKFSERLEQNLAEKYWNLKNKIMEEATHGKE